MTDNIELSEHLFKIQNYQVKIDGKSCLIYHFLIKLSANGINILLRGINRTQSSRTFEQTDL